MKTAPKAPALLRRKEVIRRTGLSTTTIYTRMAAKDFPKQIDLGGNRVGWLESEVEEWISSRVSESRAA